MKLQSRGKILANQRCCEKAFAFVEGKEDRRAKVNRYWRRIEITVIKKNNKKKKARRRRRGCR